MKAVVLEAQDALTVKDVPDATAAKGKALIRVSGTGICATDVKILTGGIPVTYPLIMGHEIVGELIDGGGKNGAKPGDPVLVDPVLTCGKCYYCQHGQANLCPVGGLIGRDQDGGFAEYVSVPSSNVYPLPDSIDLTAAPMIQVLTTCHHAHERAAIQPGEAAVITGLGVTGQMNIQLAKAAGASPVIGISRTASKRDLALELGADIVASHGEEALKVTREATDGRGADVIIESVGALAVLGETMDLARIGGRIVPFGIYTGTQAEMPFYQFYFKELSILNARAAFARDFPASIDLVASGKVRLEPLLSHALPIERADEAIHMLMEPGSDRMKVVLTY